MRYINIVSKLKEPKNKGIHIYSKELFPQRNLFIREKIFSIFRAKQFSHNIQN